MAEDTRVYRENEDGSAVIVTVTQGQYFSDVTANVSIHDFPLTNRGMGADGKRLLDGEADKIADVLQAALSEYVANRVGY